MSKKDNKTKTAKKAKKDKAKKLNNNAAVENNAVIDIAGNPYKIGDIVAALAGRDADRFFAVVGILDKDYVLIADGRSRRLDSPKKKKVRHIKLIKKSGESEKSNVCFTNAGLRNMTAAYIQDAEKVQDTKN